jgi:hypothetical protein
MATYPISPFQSLGEKITILRRAISDRRAVSATYDGRVRLVCPHVLGQNKEGKHQALFYQFGGESSRGIEPDGSPANWRCLSVEKLFGIAIVAGAWHTAPNHSRPQTCVRFIDCEVTH